MSQDVERVLIVHPFGIGDALFLTPVIRALHQKGVKKIDLIIGSRTKEIFDGHPYVSDIFVFDKDAFRAKTFREKAEWVFDFSKRLRATKYDALFDFSLTREYSFIAKFLVGIPNRVGFNYKGRGMFLTHWLALEKGFSEKHVIDYYMDLMRLTGLEPRDTSPEVFLSTEKLAEAAHIIKEDKIPPKFIVIAPGGGESWGKDARLKRWPVKYFKELFDAVSAKDTERVILGGKNEWELGESLKNLAPARFHNLCGKLSLMGSAALLKQAWFLIANDGGLVHLASAVGTPVAAIFGPVDPRVYGPYPKSPGRSAVTNDGPECRPCYKNMRYEAACQHVNCLNTLTPDMVYEKLSQQGFLSVVYYG